MWWHPSGECLGPVIVFYISCVNLLPLQVIDGVLMQYADDTTLICSGPSPQAAAEVMNSQLRLYV